MGARLSIPLLVLGLLASGCSADFAAENLGPPDCAESISLTVSPYTISRGAAVDITVTWKASTTLVGPTATLAIGVEPKIELDIPLIETSNGVHVGSLLNPFGGGAPAGQGEVVATAAGEYDCSQDPSATTTFELD